MPPVLLSCPDRTCAAIVQAPRIGETAGELPCPRCRRPLQQGAPAGTGAQPNSQIMLRCSSSGCGVIAKASVLPDDSLACPVCRAALAPVARPAPPNEKPPSAPVARLAPPPNVTRELPAPPPSQQTPAAPSLPPKATLDLSTTTPPQTPAAPPLPGNAAAALNPVLPLTVGRFTIQRFLGEGGFGRVYEAYDPSLKRQVALKVARPEQVQTPERVERFLREARSAGKLMHPHVVTVFDSGRDGAHYYIASAFVPGRSLDRVLREHDRGLDTKTAATIVRKLAEALAYAHREGVVHRDVKPANVMLRSDGEPMLMDFGLAARQDAGEQRLTQGLVPMGTPAFMAPEQWKGEAVAASDQYSLGVTLYELLTGEIPFAGGSPAHLMVLHEEQSPPAPRSRRPDVPRDLEAICLKCLEKQPQNRYPDCQALADDLRRWLAGEPVQARLPSRAERLRKWVRRNPAVAALTAAVTATLLVGTGVSLAFALYANVQASRADREAGEAKRLARDEAQAKANEEKERKNAERSAALARAQAIHLIADHGSRRALAGDPLGALPWFAGALQQDDRPGDVNKIHRLRVGAFLRYSPRLLQTFVLEGKGGHAAFSPDGKRLVTVANTPREQFRVWDVASGNPLTAPMNVKGGDLQLALPLHAAFSPDGRRLLTVVALAGFDKAQSVLQLWDVETGKPLTNTAQFSGHATYAEFNATGDRVVSVTQLLSGEVCEGRLWEGKTLRPISALEHNLGVMHGEFNDKGDCVVTAGVDGIATIWDADSGKRMADLKHGSPIKFARFKPGGKVVVTAALDGTAKLWEVATQKQLGQSMSHGGVVEQASFSHDGGSWVVTASFDGTAQVWDAASGLRQGPALAHQGQVTLASFSADGRHVVTASADRTVRLWDLSAVIGGQVSLPTVEGGQVGLIRHNATVTRAAFSPDGTQVVTASEDGIVRIWQAPPAPDAFPTDGTRRVLAIAADASRALVIDEGGDLRAWDPTTGKPLTPPLKHPQKVVSGILNAKGTHALTRCDRGKKVEVRLCNLKAPQATLLDHPNLTGQGTCFSPDGQLAATTGYSMKEFKGDVRIWNVRTGEMIGKPLEERFPVGHVCFSPDSRRIAVATHGFGMRVWDVAERKVLTPPLMLSGIVNSLAFSNDGRLIAASAMVSSNLGEAGIWEASSGTFVSRVTHAESIKCLAFSPDSTRLVTASADRTARVWDVETGKPVTPPLSHAAEVLSVAFSPDGLLVATAGNDGVARVWDAATGFAVTPTLRHRHYAVVFVAFSADGRQLITQPYEKACVWDLSPLTGPTDEVVLRAEWLAGQRLDKTSGGLVPLVWADAVEHLDVLVAAEKGNQHLVYRRGRAYADRDELEKAIDDFTTAMKRGAKHWDVWLARGEAHTRAKNWKEVVDDVSRAMELGATDQNLLVNRGSAYLKLGKHAKAVADFEQFVKRQPTFWASWFALANARAEQGEWTKAEAAYALAVGLKAPPFVQAHRAFCWLGQQNTDRYATECAAMLPGAEQFSDPAMVTWAAWASVVVPKGAASAKRVLPLLERLAADRPKCRTYLLILGAALYRVGQMDRAIEKLLEARTLYNEDLPAPQAADDSDVLDQTRYDLFFLALAYKQRGETEKAKQPLEEAEREVEKARASRSGEILWHRRLLYDLLLKEAKE